VSSENHSDDHCRNNGRGESNAAQFERLEKHEDACENGPSKMRFVMRMIALERELRVRMTPRMKEKSSGRARYTYAAMAVARVRPLESMP